MRDIGMKNKKIEFREFRGTNSGDALLNFFKSISNLCLMRL